MVVKLLHTVGINFDVVGLFFFKSVQDESIVLILTLILF
jgi:hypothetical protein